MKTLFVFFSFLLVYSCGIYASGNDFSPIADKIIDFEKTINEINDQFQAKEVSIIEIEAADKQLNQIKEKIKKIYMPGSLYRSTWTNYLKRIDDGINCIKKISQTYYSQKNGLVFISEPNSEERIISNNFIVPALNQSNLEIALCRNEIESTTFSLFALKDLRNIKIEIRNSKTIGGPLYEDSFDIYLVKCWYQSGKRVIDVNDRILVPELLLKDNELVKVDYEKQCNFLRSSIPGKASQYFDISSKEDQSSMDLYPMDSDSLKPFNLNSGMVQQIWVNFEANEKMSPGKYEFDVLISSDQFNTTIGLSLYILPFELKAAPLIYSIYYRGVLSEIGSVSSEIKNEKQYRSELLDMKKHGVLNPTAYDPDSSEKLKKSLEIRKELGLAMDAYYSLGIKTDVKTDTEDSLRNFMDRSLKLKNTVNSVGFHKLYVYGIDEAVGERLTNQKKIWRTLNENDVGVFVAVFQESVNDICDSLNVAIIASQPSKTISQRMHKYGNKAFLYAYPQVGEERPLVYRKNFGLNLLFSGYDGAMNYAYQHGFGHVWNDFDSESYRDHNFTYPTMNGIVGTLQWEGFREGVDDTRYFQTLKDAYSKLGREIPMTIMNEINAQIKQNNFSFLRKLLIKAILDIYEE